MDIFSRMKFKTIKKLKKKNQLKFSSLDKEKIKQLYFELAELKNFLSSMVNVDLFFPFGLSHFIFQIEEVLETLDYICTDSETPKAFTSLGK